MIVIPLHASVECTDGACGESVTVIVNPITEKVTHFVVKDKTLPPPAERLVPIEEVVETTSEMVRLRLRRDEMAALKPFVETQYVEGDELVPVYGTYDSFSMSPYVTPVGTHQLPIEVEQVPPGELAVYRGSRVEGTDGYVGKVGELLVDPESGHITHLVMREGHLWGKKEVTIPISTIDHVMADTVYLKLDRQSIEMLPAVPVKRHYDSSGQKYKQIGLVAKVFDEADKAAEALEFVQTLHRDHIIKLLQAAVLVKDDDGTTHLQDTKNLDPKRSRVFGAVAGGLVGLLGGPVGVVIGALAGAGVGSLASKFIDKGFSDEFLTKLQASLKPGSSALLVLVEHEFMLPLSEALKETGGIVLEQSLTDEVVQQLLAEIEAES